MLSEKENSDSDGSKEQKKTDLEDPTFKTSCSFVLVTNSHKI